MASFRYIVEVDTEWEPGSGPWASHDEQSEKIEEALESADPSSLSMDSGAEYSIASWSIARDVEGEEAAKKAYARARAKARRDARKARLARADAEEATA